MTAYSFKKHHFITHPWVDVIECLRRGEVSSVISRGGNSSANIIIHYTRITTSLSSEPQKNFDKTKGQNDLFSVKK